MYVLCVQLPKEFFFAFPICWFKYPMEGRWHLFVDSNVFAAILHTD